ncbi:teicoplanin resistance protein VanZ [Paenibacillus yonginensis]|uniref:Teicoplanin resistance protein VanZ n=1 Tax=Paenibacillus yonginensis TaxID=1462996 RepID=A0A1B1MWF6_9BACL|nr:VanZ family protein [Paenibacillus yonginensis]ANS73513.1 teicoplanin resistance protein VanZ [Paenibacillus yonginensis]
MFKQHKIIFSAAILYTVLILYFILFGFGRIHHVENTSGYTFLLLPDGFFELPSPSDLLHPTLMDLVTIGNIAAFIPFGIAVPLLYRIKFTRFIVWFILSIFLIETVQALTYLGSFDVNDVIQNSFGAIIGFGTYRLGIHAKNGWRRIAAMGFSAIVLLLGVWGICGGIDRVFTKVQGPFTALNELGDSAGNPVKETKPYRFTVGGQDIEPQFNVYSAEGKEKAVYTYKLNKKEFYFYLQYGIPDQSDFKGNISVSVDGQQILFNSEKYQAHAPAIFKWYFEQVNELTITVEGNEKVWDIGYRGMKYFWN